MRWRGVPCRFESGQWRKYPTQNSIDSFRSVLVGVVLGPRGPEGVHDAVICLVTCELKDRTVALHHRNGCGPRSGKGRRIVHCNFVVDCVGVDAREAFDQMQVRRRIAACGVCLPLLWTQGNTDGAVWLERLWDDLVKKHELDILCAYPSSNFHGGKDEHAYKNICAQHTAVYSR
jgi:hypothetical protein